MQKLGPLICASRGDEMKVGPCMGLIVDPSHKSLGVEDQSDCAVERWTGDHIETGATTRTTPPP